MVELNRPGDQTESKYRPGLTDTTFPKARVPSDSELTGNVNTGPGPGNNKSLLTWFLPEDLRQIRTIVYQTSQ